MKKIVNEIILLIIFSSSAVAFYSCQDFIEININNKAVTLLSPTDGYETKTSTVSFWWGELNGAEGYELEIIKPNFTQPQQLIIDSVLTGYQFSLSLPPGAYQWRVRATNNGGSTIFTTRSFIIDSTADLNSQTIALVSPINNLYTNNMSVIFKWDTLYNASDYRLQIINQTSTLVIEDTATTSGSLSFTLAEGIYTWQVRAENAGSNSPYSYRTLAVDTTAPVISMPHLPVDSGTSLNPVTLIWNRDATATGDSLFISSDSLSTVVFNGLILNTFYTFSGTVGQSYHWWLRSTDAAGNWSYMYSRSFRFTIQ